MTVAANGKREGIDLPTRISRQAKAIVTMPSGSHLGLMQRGREAPCGQTNQDSVRGAGDADVRDESQV